MDAMNQAARRRVEAGGLKNPPLAPKCVQTHFQRVSRFFSAIHRPFTLAVGFNHRRGQRDGAQRDGATRSFQWSGDLHGRDDQAARRRVEAGGLKNPPLAPKCVQRLSEVSRFLGGGVRFSFPLAVGFTHRAVPNATVPNATVPPSGPPAGSNPPLSHKTG